MNMLQAMGPLALRAITDPREAAETLLSMGVPKEAHWPGLILVVICGAILSGLGEFVAPTVFGQVPLLVMAGLMLVVFSSFALAVHWIGVQMGGKGAFDEAVLMTAFVQGLVACAQVVQLAVLILVTPMAPLFSIAVTLIGLWININFIDALHGFRSLWRSAAVFFLSSIAVAFAVGILSGLLGVRVGGAF